MSGADRGARDRLPYRAAKTLHLFSQGAVLPIAVHYLLHAAPTTVWRGLLIAGIYAIIPFWIVLFIGLSMYRFPLRRNEALRVTGVMLLEFAVFYGLGGDLLYSAYALFIASFAGITLALLRFGIRELIGGHRESIPGAWRSMPLLIGLFLAISAFLYALLDPFIRDLGLIPGLLGRTMAVGALILNAASIALAAGRDIGRTVEDAEKAERDAEWERWATPTAMVLILSLLGGLGIAIAT